MKQPLIILTGPTAVGKTALSIELAKAVNGEIISADSMQVYRGMDIGTAKIHPEEMQGIPHHLIDILSPQEAFHVADFQKRCKQCMQEIYSRSKIPILVGGTGFYIQAVLYDIQFQETKNHEDYRLQLEQEAKEQGAEVLHQKLAEVDPEAAKQIHPNNIKRVIRALEYYQQTGKQISKHNEEERAKDSPYHFVYYVLNLPREVLYERINKRVEQMRQEGLEAEVKRLLEEGCRQGMVSMQGLGYKEMIQAIQGEISLEEAYDKIKQETRHFAKRQLTWFRRERDVIWVQKEQYANEAEVLDFLLKDLKQRFLL